MDLSTQDREYLLALARQTISHALASQPLPSVDPEALPETLSRSGASFVTLTLADQLRGCIGSIEPRQPLAVDVQENAVGAAFRDPRFPPLSKGELEQVHIEVSVLTQPEPLSYDGPEDLLGKLRPHVDGVVIEREGRRATFLPQVWEKLPDPREFVEHLCAKAGLSFQSYRIPGLNVLIYQVEKFAESQED